MFFISPASAKHMFPRTYKVCLFETLKDFDNGVSLLPYTDRDTVIAVKGMTFLCSRTKLLSAVLKEFLSETSHIFCGGSSLLLALLSSFVIKVCHSLAC